MNLQELSHEVQAQLESAREALLRLEQAAQAGDRPEIHAASRLYAQFCAHARGYLSGAQMGRPYPRRFGQQLGELLANLQDYEALARELALSPSMEDLARLVRLAQEAG